MRVRQAVLLVGSARPRGESTSETLGRYLLERLTAQGFRSRVFYVNRVRRDAGMALLVHELKQSDLLLLASPVYVDSLPYLVTHALEQLAEIRALPGERQPCRFAAVVNCGFPEASHTHVPLDICRSFARHADLSWAGGLGLGGGEALKGRSLEASGWMARDVRRALDLAGDALAAERNIPPAACDLMERPLLPAWLYTRFANANWRRQAKRNHALALMAARPYALPMHVGAAH